MRDVFFVAEGEVQARLGVTVINDAMPMNELRAVEADHEQALRVLVDIPAGYAIRELREWPRPLCARTVVVTGNPSLLYADALRSFGVLSTVSLTDSRRSVAFKLSVAVAGERSEKSYSMLTPAQARVLRLLLAGLPTAEIGSALSMGLKTVNAHVSGLLERAGTPDRTTLVARVLGGLA